MHDGAVDAGQALAEQGERRAEGGPETDERYKNFYTRAVRQVAEQERQERGGTEDVEYYEELIHLGCVQFVTSAGGRKMMLRERERTGRLTNETLVWKPGMAEWTKAGAASEFAEFF